LHPAAIKMSRFLGIVQTGLAALRLHPLRSIVTTAAVATLLIPFLTGLAISQGVEAEAEASVQFGADLYVTGQQFGRDVPVPVSMASQIEKLAGVRDVVPRIVGSLTLGKEHEPVVLVGLPPEKFPPSLHCVRGRLPQMADRNEFVIGTELARRLSLDVSSRIPPFFSGRGAAKTSEVVGVFEADAPLWQTRMILTPFQKAADIFDEPGLATDLLVFCRQGYQEQVRETIERAVFIPSVGETGRVLPKVTTRADLEALLPQGSLQREGIFNLHFVLAFVVGILVIMVTSGIGLAERRREIGVLKATGWQTDELLLRSLVESLAISLVGAGSALVLAWLWLRVFNGYWIASLFLAGSSASPSFTVPARLAPVPFLLSFVLSFAVVMSGTLFSTWRAAVAPPREAMR